MRKKISSDHKILAATLAQDHEELKAFIKQRDEDRDAALGNRDSKIKRTFKWSSRLDQLLTAEQLADFLDGLDGHSRPKRLAGRADSMGTFEVAQASQQSCSSRPSGNAFEHQAGGI